MNQTLLIDTCVLVEYERGNPAAIDLLKSNKHAVSTVSIMEFDQGNKKPFSEVFKAAKVIDLDHASANYAGKIIAQLRQQKTPKGKPLHSKETLVRLSFDAMIAATAIIHHLTIVTDNTKDFKLFKGIEAHTI